MGHIFSHHNEWDSYNVYIIMNGTVNVHIIMNGTINVHIIMNETINVQIIMNVTINVHIIINGAQFDWIKTFLELSTLIFSWWFWFNNNNCNPDWIA